MEALELCGQADVLSKGRALAKGEKPLVQALDRLANVYRLLCETGFQEAVLLDLGEFRGFDYYDGIVFDVFTDGMGVELGGGGRYNHLIGRFGRDLPSTGFALSVDRLFQGLDLSGERRLGSRGVGRGSARVVDTSGVGCATASPGRDTNGSTGSWIHPGRALIGAAIKAGLEAELTPLSSSAWIIPNPSRSWCFSRATAGDGGSPDMLCS